MFGSDFELGSLLAAVLSLSVNFAQSAFRKFHLLTGLVGTELMVVDDSIIDGLCWDFGKRSRTRRLAHVPRLAKPRSGFVDVPHRAERKLRACLGSYNNVTSVLEAKCSSVVPSVLVELFPHVVLWQLKSSA